MQLKKISFKFKLRSNYYQMRIHVIVANRFSNSRDYCFLMGKKEKFIFFPLFSLKVFFGKNLEFALEENSPN